MRAEIPGRIKKESKQAAHKFTAIPLQRQNLGYEKLAGYNINAQRMPGVACVDYYRFELVLKPRSTSVRAQKMVAKTRLSIITRGEEP